MAASIRYDDEQAGSVTTPDTPRAPMTRRSFGTALAVGAAGLLAACTSSPKKAASSAPASSTPATSSHPATPTTSASSSATGAPVTVSLFQGDGGTYGVGFAIIALFDVAPTSGREFNAATKVTANGTPVAGNWFFQKSEIGGGAAMEAIWRPQTFWPAHAAIHLDLPVQGVSAGPGLVFADDLTLDVKTGAKNVSTIDNATKTMTVVSDGRVVRTMPVSLGSAAHPTYNGTKVVMQKGEKAPGSSALRPDGEVRMVGDDYDLLVPWSVRITNSGEYIHSASWNTGNIGSRDTSHGCTNLDVAAAQWFYEFAQIGDVATYPDANAQNLTQPSWDGWGWWNLPWSQWTQGGLLKVA